jgi:hypothetical protein
MTKLATALFALALIFGVAAGAQAGEGSPDIAVPGQASNPG